MLDEGERLAAFIGRSIPGIKTAIDDVTPLGYWIDIAKGEMADDSVIAVVEYKVDKSYGISRIKGEISYGEGHEFSADTREELIRTLQELLK